MYITGQVDGEGVQIKIRCYFSSRWITGFSAAGCPKNTENGGGAA